MKRVKILLVEDDQVDQMAFERFVGHENLPYDYEIVSSISSARNALASGRFDATLVDYSLGDGTALDLLDEVEDTPIIVITGSGDEEIAVRAMKAGAADYLIKDPEGNYLTTLPATVENATRRWCAEEELRQYRDHLEELVKERTKELRDAQEQLVRREKLAVLGQLAGSVSHELRNPLGAITNAVYYLNMVLTDADETTRECLDIISTEVRNSTKIVSDLLDLARIRPAERKDVSVSELVSRAMLRQAPPKGVHISNGVTSDLPPVCVDSGQIGGQVLVNLLANAYQAMPEGGTLIISAQVEQDQAAISIADSGCGIPPENVEKIFEPLFSTKARGIGLGLAICRNLVQANGGSICAASAGVPGKGSTFTIKLPLAQAND